MIDSGARVDQPNTAIILSFDCSVIEEIDQSELPVRISEYGQFDADLTFWMAFPLKTAQFQVGKMIPEERALPGSALLPDLKGSETGYDEGTAAHVIKLRVDGDPTPAGSIPR